jgi:hypothetical protein
MQPMSFEPSAAGIGGSVVASATQGLASGTTASAAVTGLAPAGADEVSMQAAMAFASDGVEALAMHSFAQEELARAGAAYVEIAGMYTAVDGATAATLL